MDGCDYFLAGFKFASLAGNGHFLRRVKVYLHFSDERQEKTDRRASVFGERQLDLLCRSWARHPVAVGESLQESDEGILFLVRQFKVSELLFIEVG
jgi:hypothetical protein